MASQEWQPYQFEFIAGALCLDFTNTIGGARGGTTHEHMLTYADLIAWGTQAKLMTEGRTALLMDEAGRRPDEATHVLERALTLREATFSLISAATGGKPDQEALAVLNRELAWAMSHSHVSFTSEGYRWELSEAPEALDSILWQIARSAADLLISHELDRVRECASETCSWLFVDTTKNRSRRWCDMNSCGNRYKVRKFRAKPQT